MDFKQKYLKYKTKYLKLQNKLSNLSGSGGPGMQNVTTPTLDNTEEILTELNNIYKMCDSKHFYKSKELWEKVDLFSDKYFSIRPDGSFCQDPFKNSILDYIQKYQKIKKIKNCNDIMTHLSVCKECLNALNNNTNCKSTLDSCKEVMLHCKECKECIKTINNELI